MSNAIEIYLRPLGNGAILNLYIPRSRLDEFITSLRDGSFDERGGEMAFEMSVLPSWYSGIDAHHVRVPVSSINLIAADEED